MGGGDRFLNYTSDVMLMHKLVDIEFILMTCSRFGIHFSSVFKQIVVHL